MEKTDRELRYNQGKTQLECEYYEIEKGHETYI